MLHRQHLQILSLKREKNFLKPQLRKLKRAVIGKCFAGLDVLLTTNFDTTQNFCYRRRPLFKYIKCFAIFVRCNVLSLRFLLFYITVTKRKFSSFIYETLFILNIFLLLLFTNKLY